MHWLSSLICIGCRLVPVSGAAALGGVSIDRSDACIYDMRAWWCILGFLVVNYYPSQVGASEWYYVMMLPRSQLVAALVPNMKRNHAYACMEILNHACMDPFGRNTHGFCENFTHVRTASCHVQTTHSLKISKSQVWRNHSHRTVST
jgi:hypothetical protein